jgi:hypothetical protein
MTQSGDPGDAERRRSIREMFAHLPPSAPPLRASLSPQPLDSYEGAALARARNRAAGGNPWVFVTATALSTTVAAVLAVLVTLGIVNKSRPAVEAQDAAPATHAPAPPVVAAAPEPATGNAAPLQISLRPVGSPDQPLQLEPQRPAPLPLQIKPEEGANEPFILALAGAPAGTVLSGANRISSDTWFLPPGAADRLEIVLPEWSTSVFEIAIVLLRTDGQVATQARAWIAVPPPAGAAPDSGPGDEAAVRDLTRDLLAQADRLIARGDIVGARAVYQRAAELGSAPAALALGTTYDPNRLWSLGVLGLAGNKERARHWYQRAGELGNAEAKARLTAFRF